MSPVLARAQRPWSSAEDMPDDLRELLATIKRRFEQEMEPVHKPYREHWDYLNGLYFNFDQLRSKWREARDRDESSARGVLLDASREWGGHLVIPYAYASVETVVPRTIANRPQFVAKALKSEAEEKKQLIGDAVNQQLSDIDLELKLGPVCRRACKLGLGVQFSYWQTDSREVMRWGRNMLGQLKPTMTTVVDREGPQVEDVDIYDFFWDPTAKSIETCQDILYRTWRSFDYVKQKVESGEWNQIDLETVKNMDQSQVRSGLWQGRMEAQGIQTDTRMGTGSTDVGKVHEVWQYWTRGRVVTILNRALIVQNDTTPLFHREFPFQAYRPTPVEGQFPGLSVTDSITQLIAELSTMRTQRRDAATYALNPPTFYSRGMIERRHMKSGPGVWVPVTGDIKEAVWRPSMGDLPGSAYTEEDRLKQDIEMTSGVSDPSALSGGAPDTATGIQFIQAASSVRVSLMARALLLETMKPFGRQVLELNRQHQVKPQEFRVADPTAPDGYRFETITPDDWNLPLELVPEEHSNEPENRPQKIDEALQRYQALQANPRVNQDENVKSLLEAYGIRDPQAWISSQVQLDPHMAQVVGESLKGTLVGAGMDEQKAEVIAMTAMESAMHATGVTQTPGENGNQPQEAPA